MTSLPTEHWGDTQFGSSSHCKRKMRKIKPPKAHELKMAKRGKRNITIMIIVGITLATLYMKYM